MKAIWYDRTGPAAEVLQSGDLPKPLPDAGELLVKLAVSGANPSDWKSRSGGGRPMAFPRVIPHSDGAGVIEAVGEGVERARIGQRVWIWNGQWKRAFGTAAEYIALPSAQAVELPAHTSFEAGACLGIPALTALHALLSDGGVAGQRVLVTGGAGSVGYYAIQFARLLGAAQVLTTVSGEAKAAHALSAGADATINYRSEDVPQRIAALTGGVGVDRVVDVDVAATSPMLPAILAPGGICVAYGSNQAASSMTFGAAILKGIAIRWFIVYELSATQRATALGTLNTWLRADLVKHSIAARVPLAECAAAHDAIQAGKYLGNLVLEV